MVLRMDRVGKAFIVVDYAGRDLNSRQISSAQGFFQSQNVHSGANF